MSGLPLRYVMPCTLTKIIARVFAASLLCVPATQAQTASKAAAITFDARLAHDRFVSARECLGQITTRLQAYHAQQICELAHDIACSTEPDEQPAYGGNNRASDGALACPISDPELVEQQYRLAVKNAAAQGFADAQVCFVQGAFRINSASEAEDYRRTAARYISDGLARGDWRVVYLLATPMEAAAHGAGALSSLEGIGNPMTVYRAIQLLMLGADAGYRRELRYLADVPSRFLSKAQRAKAQAWAYREYRSYFIDSPTLRGEPQICD